jgi:small-conductance mechanosensitive channel
MNEINVFLESQYWGNSLARWLTALMMFLVLWMVFHFVVRRVSSKIEVYAKKTETPLNGLVVGILSATREFFMFALALYLSLKILNFTDRFHDRLDSAIIIMFLVQAGFWGSAGIHFWLEKVLKKKAAVDASTATTMGLIGFGARIIFFVVIALMILSNMGVNITALVAGLGIGGIAIGLALQNILGDLFASLVIVLDKPFIVGDAVNIGAFNGNIEYIGIKTTRIRSVTGEQLIFSNGDILKNTIRNYKRMQERTIEFFVNVSYDTPIEVVRELPADIRKIVAAQPKVRLDRAHFQALGTSAVIFDIVYIMLDSNYGLYMDTQQEINLQIMELFRAKKVQFASSSTKLIWDGKGGASSVSVN